MKRKKILLLILISVMLYLIAGCVPTDIGLIPTCSPEIKSFLANPSVINQGGSSTLTWEVSCALDITISPDVGSVGSSTLPTGNIVVSPKETTTYTLTVTRNVGPLLLSDTANVTITVIKKVAKIVLSGEPRK